MPFDHDASISKLERAHSTRLAELEELNNKALGEDRDLTEEEQTRYRRIEADLDDLETRLERATALEERKGRTARRAGDPPARDAGAKPGMPRRQARGETRVDWTRKDPRHFFARQAIAMYKAGNNRFAAAEYAARELGDEVLAGMLKDGPEAVLRAAVDGGTTTDPAWAGPLVAVREAAELFFEMLRPKSVFAAVSGIELNFDRNGSIKIPRQTAGSSGFWVGEASAIPVSKLGFGPVILEPRKVAVIVFSTQELLDHSTPNAEMLITEDLLRGTAQTIDTTFTGNQPGTANRPAGIRTYDPNPTPSAGSDLADILQDVRAAKQGLVSKLVPMEKPVWITNSSAQIGLSLVQDSVGQPAFPEVDGGSFRGYPMEASQSVEDVLMLLDTAFLIKAFDLAPVIDSSGDATIHADSAPSDDLATPTSGVVSMYQTDQVAIRCRQRLDWGMRQAEAIKVIEDVAY